MGNKFSNFTNNNLNDFVKNNQDVLQNAMKNNPQGVNNIGQMVSQYQGLSGDQLYQKLMQVVQEKKQNGTLTLSYIQNMRQMLYPYLSEEQKQIFENLLNTIR